MSENEKVLCIDFGNQFTVVAECENGDVSIKNNPLGKRFTPSVISFSTDNRLLFGDFAVSLTCTNENGTAYNMKQGLNTDDDILTLDNGKTFKSQEIVAYYLKNITKDDKIYDKYVFSIPMWWSDYQRSKFIEALDIADIKGMLIETNKALAYDFHARFTPDDGTAQYIMLSDSGSVGTDISFYKIESKDITLLSYKHVAIGGEHFTCALANYLLDYFIGSQNENIKDTALSIKEGKDPRLSRIFFNAVRGTKENLTKMTAIQFEAVGISSEFDMKKILEYSEFEELPEVQEYKNILEQAYKETFNQALADGKIPEGTSLFAAEIVGGNGRSELMKRMCKEALGGNETTQFLSTIEACAEGLGYAYLMRDEIKYNVGGDDSVPTEYVTEDGDDTVIYAKYKENEYKRLIYDQTTLADKYSSWHYRMDDNVKNEYKVLKYKNAVSDVGSLHKDENGIIISNEDETEENYMRSKPDDIDQFRNKEKEIFDLENSQNKLAEMMNDLQNISLSLGRCLKRINNSDLVELFEPVINESAKFVEENENSKDFNFVKDKYDEINQKCWNVINTYYSPIIEVIKNQFDSLPRNKNDQNQSLKETQEQWENFQTKVVEELKKHKTLCAKLNSFKFMENTFETELNTYKTRATNVLRQYTTDQNN